MYRCWPHTFARSMQECSEEECKNQGGESRAEKGPIEANDMLGPSQVISGKTHT